MRLSEKAKEDMCSILGDMDGNIVTYDEALDRIISLVEADTEITAEMLASISIEITQEVFNGDRCDITLRNYYTEVAERLTQRIRGGK